jgi:hypothetical protein
MNVERLVETSDVAAFRVHGRPRDPENGRHRQVVAFSAATVSPIRLAGYLRELATLIETQVIEP